MFVYDTQLRRCQQNALLQAAAILEKYLSLAISRQATLVALNGCCCFKKEDIKKGFLQMDKVF